MSGDVVLSAGPSAGPAAGAPVNRGDWLVNQLPGGLLAEDFFVRFVRIFQAQAETLLSHADSLSHLADPRLAPLEMVRYMAGWLGLPGVDASYPERTQRAVLLTAAANLPWRGTPGGVLRLLELYSGAPAQVEEGGGVWAEGQAPDDVAWVRLRVESTGLLETSDFVQLVLDEVPAHLRAEIIVGGTCVWPPAAGGVAGGVSGGWSGSSQEKGART